MSARGVLAACACPSVRNVKPERATLTSPVRVGCARCRLPFVSSSPCSAYLTWRDGRTALLDCNTHLPIEDVNPEDYGFYATSPAISDSPPAELPHRAHTMAKSHEVEDRVEAFLASLRD